MFPTLRVSFSGLHPTSSYSVFFDIVPLDNKRYRYAYHRSSWLVAGKADPSMPPRLCRHPDSPFTGEQLAKQLISFEKVKLTNNEMDKHGHVSVLTPFHILIFFFLQLLHTNNNYLCKYNQQYHNNAINPSSCLSVCVCLRHQRIHQGGKEKKT